MKKSDLTYVAGLFDGEGSCGLHYYRATKNGKKYLRIQANITNTDHRCLDFVKAVLGFGWVGVSSRPKKKKWKIAYRFVVQHEAAKRFLKLLRPHVKIKGEQIDKALVGLSFRGKDVRFSAE